MRAVLISIHPQWCELIANGKKTVEVRKNRPKLPEPFKVYIYCTKGYFHKDYSDTAKDWKANALGKVIGEFVCDSIRAFDVPYPAFQREMDKSILDESCLTYYQLHRYAYHDKLYAWHISGLKLFDKPMEVQWLQKPTTPEMWWPSDVSVTRPPQSWCYVEEMPNDNLE